MTRLLWERARSGERLTGSHVVLTPELARSIVDAGGYVHPLFTDPGHAGRSGFPGIPLPGQGVLLLLGGLAERSGHYGPDVIALLGFDDVRFHRPLTAGETLALETELAGAEPTADPGRGLVRARWRATTGTGEPVATATALFLVRTTR